MNLICLECKKIYGLFMRVMTVVDRIREPICVCT